MAGDRLLMRISDCDQVHRCRLSRQVPAGVLQRDKFLEEHSAGTTGELTWKKQLVLSEVREALHNPGLLRCVLINVRDAGW